MAKRNLWDSLLEPINPHLCVLLGVLNILYGAWGVLPGASEPLAYLDFLGMGDVWSVITLLMGIILFFIHKWGEPSQLSFPMSINGVLWAVMSGLVLFGDVHSNLWVLMGGVAIYSIFVSANLHTHFGYKRKINN
ncbi:hypothetical protein SEA_NICEHOUSE_58 [Rhodococcus phage NiceHouse]|nr:hypothetical protein SEA_NICEHOUSE_58 [Rhodococcus phage NiceHouse]